MSLSSRSIISCVTREPFDHLLRNAGDARLEPVRSLRRRGQLGTEDEQLALDAQDVLVDLVVVRATGRAAEPERARRLIHRAVRLGPATRLRHAAPVPEPRGAVVSL